MRKFFVLLLIVLSACFIGGIYGILHDQITYTISPEYYTRFKFIQFGLADNDFYYVPDQIRLHVAAVGFLATWWLGIPIGLILGLVGLIHKDWKVMWKITFRSLLLCLGIALLTGLTGLIYGYLVLVDQGVRWWLPDGLVDRANFIAVGSMHNFSYLGGLIGLLGGIIFQIIVKRKIRS